MQLAGTESAARETGTEEAVEEYDALAWPVTEPA